MKEILDMTPEELAAVMLQAPDFMRNAMKACCIAMGKMIDEVY